MKSGSIFAGRFAIEDMAGRGAMGAVYRARDIYAHGVLVALKVLHELIPKRVRRFEREIQVLARLGHTNIVGYVSHGVQHDQPWLAMQWLDGMTLAERLRQRPLSMAESLQLGLEVCEALIFAHDRGVVHRDLKPGNVFLDAGETKRVFVLDFGIAHIDADEKLTSTGTFLGSPGYLAPEQARGEAVDHRADLFSLGCLLYRCLTEVEAFPGRQVAERILKALHERPVSPRSMRPHLPAELEELVLQMLAKHPLRRPEDAAEVRSRLSAIASEPSIDVDTFKRAGVATTLPLRLAARAFAVISPDPADRASAAPMPMQPEHPMSALPIGDDLGATLPMVSTARLELRALRQTLPIGPTEPMGRSMHRTMPFRAGLDGFGRVRSLPDGSILIWVKPEQTMAPMLDRVLDSVRALRDQARDVAVLACDPERVPDPGLFGRGLALAAGPTRLDEATASALAGRAMIGHDHDGAFLVETVHAH